jgi:hypothetical protein
MSIRERNILIAVGPYSLCLGQRLFLICHGLRLSDIVVRGARRVSARSRNAGEFRKLSPAGRLVAFSSSWNGIEPLPVDWVGAHSCVPSMIESLEVEVLYPA